MARGKQRERELETQLALHSRSQRHVKNITSNINYLSYFDHKSQIMITRSKRDEGDLCITACHQIFPSPLLVAAPVAATISADEFKEKGGIIEKDLLCDDDEESDSDNEYSDLSNNYEHLMKYNELLLARGKILARRQFSDEDDDVVNESCMCRYCQYNTGTCDYMDEDDSSDDEDEYTSNFKERVIKSSDNEFDTDDHDEKKNENNANSWSVTKKKLTFYEDIE